MDIPQAFEEIAVFNHSKKCFLCSGDSRRKTCIYCAVIDKDGTSSANDNFLIMIPFFGSFSLLVTVLFVVERG